MSDGAGKYRRLLNEAIENLSQYFFDSFEHGNAEFRSRAGLPVIVIREELGDCCSWCADLAGTYDYVDAPPEVWQRHGSCRCMVITRTEKGAYQDAWSRKEYQSYKEARIARAEEIEEEQASGYYGVPKTWTKEIIPGDELLRGTNPGFIHVWNDNINNSNPDRSLNCSNCVPAYEMRCRGYNVEAQPYSKNKSLRKDPFLAWKNAKPLATNNVEDIVSFVKNQENGARVQIVTEFPHSIWTQTNNHTFVAEKIDGKCVFKDPQSGVIINNTKHYFEGTKEIRYLRIDILEITDRGISACKIIKK